jgi:hypothetical protein
MSLESTRLLRSLVLAIDDELSKISDEDLSVEDLADTLLELNLAKADLGFVYKSAEARLAKVMSDKIMDLRDGAQIERKSASNRSKWRHKDLAADVINRISQSSVDMDTGEVILSPADMVIKLLDYVAPSYWRVEELNKIGINADNYCETSDPEVSLILRKGNAS